MAPRMILDQRIQPVEELAILARLALGFALLARLGHEPAQGVRIGVGILGEERLDRRRIGDHVAPPALGRVEERGLAARRRRQRVELRDDGAGVVVAHDASDVLQLAAHRFVPGKALAVAHRLAQLLRQVEPRELLLGELHQRGAHFLQLAHLLFAPRLADKILLFHSASLSDARHGSCRPSALARPDGRGGAGEAVGPSRRTEAAALALDRRITNSEGATVSASDSDFVLANSLGFEAGFASSKSSIGCGVVAEDRNGMQRDYWYTTHRDPGELEGAESVGRIAGERTVGRLGARRVPTSQAPALFRANIPRPRAGPSVPGASGHHLCAHS